jgi:hypothetical protein
VLFVSGYRDFPLDGRIERRVHLYGYTFIEINRGDTIMNRKQKAIDSILTDIRYWFTEVKKGLKRRDHDKIVDERTVT